MPETCPNCKADLRDLEHAAPDGSYPYLRIIGGYSIGRDMTTRWRCPDCKHEWPREFKEN